MIFGLSFFKSFFVFNITVMPDPGIALLGYNNTLKNLDCSIHKVFDCQEVYSETVEI